MVLEEAIVEPLSSRPDHYVLQRVSSLDIQRVDNQKEREQEREEKGRDKRRWHMQLVAHDVGCDSMASSSSASCSSRSHRTSS
jgi:hypothetical protein